MIDQRQKHRKWSGEKIESGREIRNRKRIQVLDSIEEAETLGTSRYSTTQVRNISGTRDQEIRNLGGWMDGFVSGKGNQDVTWICGCDIEICIITRLLSVRWFDLFVASGFVCSGVELKILLYCACASFLHCAQQRCLACSRLCSWKWEWLGEGENRSCGDGEESGIAHSE